MFKAVKVILLLAVLFVAGVGIYIIAHQAPSAGGGAGSELRSPARENQPVRVEEKYGVTTEQPGP